MDNFVPRFADGAIAVAVVGFALWTLVFHLAIALNLRSDVTAVLWVVLGILAVFSARKLTPRASSALPQSATVVDPLVAGLFGFFGLALALGVGLFRLQGLSWTAFWFAVVGFLVTAVSVVLRSKSARPVRQVTSGAAFILAAAVGLAFFTAGGRSFNGDDSLLINRSLFIEHAQGEAFPEVDTLFSNGEFTYSRPDNPAAAIEPFIGVAARALPVPAATTAYLVVAPLVSALTVFGIYRLLRSLRARSIIPATVVGAFFLVLAGDPNRSPASSILALHQGKYILCLFVLPLLWAFALEWSRDNNPRSLLLLIAGGITAVGLSSTALFLVPPVIGAGCLCGIIADPERNLSRRLLGTGLALAYPVASAMFALIAASPPMGPLTSGSVVMSSPVLARGAAHGVPPSDPAAAWWISIGAGPTAAIATAAALTAWIFVRDRAGRLALLASPLLVFAFFFLPWVFNSIVRAIGSEMLLDRVLWIVPVPAAVGLLLTAPLGMRQRFAGRIITGIAVTITTIVLATFGMPISERFYEWTLRPAPWDLFPGSERSARKLIELAENRGTVAGPSLVEVAIAVTSPDVRGVSPRRQEISGFATVPGFHSRERELISTALSSLVPPRSFDTKAFVDALDILKVRALCVNMVFRTEWYELFRSAGFVEVGYDPVCTYWKRTSPRGTATES